MAATPARADRFEAFLRDGERISGQRLIEIHDYDEARLSERRLFASENPVRYVRDAQQAVRRQGAYVEMTNGDVLPGQVVGWTPATAAVDSPAEFLVAVGDVSRGSDLWSGKVAIRADCVRRVHNSESGTEVDTPGWVASRDGRGALARSLRFTSSGVEALTDAGVFAVDFGALSHLTFPQSTGPAELLWDGAWSAAADDFVVRVVTTCGAELTYSGAMAALASLEQRRRGTRPTEFLAIRPVWALDTLYVNPAAVVSYSYRRPDEIPLSLLPAEALEQRSMLHRWSWRRNASVGGGPLQSGRLASDLGVGMHSYSAVAFTLPPGALEFSTWVGLSASVGRGGCVRCRIHRDALDGAKLWESDFLCGGQEPVRVGPLDVRGATRLVLVVDYGHEGRPAGADPWDLRDEVDWIDSLVTIARERLPHPESEPQRWIPQLAGWEISAALRGRLKLRPFWDEAAKRWTIILAPQISHEQPFELTRRMQIDLTNAVLPVVASNAIRGRARHSISVKVDGDDVDSSVRGDVSTRPSRRSELPAREWNLGAFRNRNVQLSVVIEPVTRSSDPMGLIFQDLGPRPLVENLPADGRPMTPDVPLTVLQPLSATAQGQHLQLKRGQLPDGTPLEIRGWQFEEGFGVPTESEITYRLDPQWQRLVAIIGLADGWQGAGPYSILLDGQLHWECTTPASFTRSSPALQIDVPIPPGHQTITLRVQGKDSHAAWACAGFVESPRDPVK
jgi:hypothetical protein